MIIEKSQLLNKIKATKILQGYFDSLKDRLALIADNEKDVSEIAEQSYVHLNGFSKIVLTTDRVSNYKIRLHIWQNPVDKKDLFGEIHDHRWSFLSIPIYGEFLEKRYLEKAKLYSDIKMYKYKCFSKGESEWLDIEGCKQVGLSEVFSSKRTIGEIYSCTKGEIHTFTPTLFPAATIVITYNPAKEYARVYRKKRAESNKIRVKVIPLDKVGLKEKIEHLLKKI